ncbi:MAG: hypothetical protein IKZ82_00060, partial [Clostridia bacterium]|nr:hypothetical protein [Clostridia bacterium]
MIKTRSTLLCSLLVIAFVLCTLTAPALAAAADGERVLQATERDESRAVYEAPDFERSEQLPFDDSWQPLPEKANKFTPEDDFSTIRVLLNFEDTVVSRINLTLYGAYYIDQNLKPIV